MKTSGFRVSGFIHTSAYIPPTNLVTSKGPATPEKKEVTDYAYFHQRDTDAGMYEEPSPGFPSGKKWRGVSMSRGPRPHRALAEALPIAQLRGIVQVSCPGPERIYDISIISKIPVTFARVMFAPQIMAAIAEIAEDFRDEITKLRIIARDACITAELWLRSRHGIWRFFLVSATGLIEIDRDGKLLVSGQTLA